MIPSSFAESNAVLDPPKGVDLDKCSALSIFRGQDQSGGNVVISCWKMTAEEREEFLRTGRVWLFVWGKSMPPVAIATANPFTEPCNGREPD